MLFDDFLEYHSAQEGSTYKVSYTPNSLFDFLLVVYIIPKYLYLIT